MNENTPLTESVAKALIINQRNDVLILTIGEHKAQPARSFAPDLPGGLVDPGETERDAVIREIYEETGIAITDEQPRLVYSKTEYSTEHNKSVSKFLYLIFLDDEPDVVLSWEHASCEWIPLNELKERVDLRPFYNEAVEYCFKIKLLN